MNHLFPALSGSAERHYFPFGAAAQYQHDRSRAEHFRGASRKPPGKLRSANRRIELERGGGKLGQQALKGAIETRRYFADSL